MTRVFLGKIFDINNNNVWISIGMELNASGFVKLEKPCIIVTQSHKYSNFVIGVFLPKTKVVNIKIDINKIVVVYVNEDDFVTAWGDYRQFQKTAEMMAGLPLYLVKNGNQEIKTRDINHAVSLLKPDGQLFMIDNVYKGAKFRRVFV